MPKFLSPPPAMPHFFASLTERLVLALESAGHTAFEWTRQDNVVHFSGEACETLRLSIRDLDRPVLVGALLRRLHGGDRRQLLSQLLSIRPAEMKDSHPGVKLVFCELRIKIRAGCWRWLRLHARILEWDNTGMPVRLVGTLCDIHEQKRAQRLQDMQTHLLKMIATGTELRDILLALQSWISEWHGDLPVSLHLHAHDDQQSQAVPSMPNPALTEISGRVAAAAHCAYLEGRITPDSPFMVTDRHALTLLDSELGVLAEMGVDSAMTWLICSADRRLLGSLILFCHSEKRPLVPDEHAIHTALRLAGMAIARRRADERVHRLAHYDGLTGLANRMLLHEHLHVALQRASREKTRLAVCFLDLDEFKSINDNHGHQAGDEVLREVAVRLRAALRHSDKIARLGGDEFCVLIEGLQDLRSLREIADKMLNAVSQPVRLGGSAHQVSMSVGIAVYPDSGSDAETLLANADTAMYAAKQSGKNAYRLHTAPIQDLHTLPQRLQAAIESPATETSRAARSRPQLSSYSERA